ncbi:SGNH/GDSL hydrolase family protein [Glaciecola sp. 33A]|jgi:lysophospholipase L1-like esterase|uniref:SGNH/GDSL hydrolase family protein n=1 Tax=Glaciecola sp. 33A TaxID=2057807 RepID=UPI000C34F785|nr:SGNH/GDSL hydrolase family protein [Glaciecola sp. 33A]PKI01268.1 SGNH/GDSL hydrolase family protein [Glaciecola sp. 33A]
MRKTIVSIVMCSSLFTVIAVFSRDSLAAELKKGANYVALGSSFAAGPGIASQLGSCGRSDHNYSHLVASALSLKLTDVTCNGATIANILDTSLGDSAPQIDSVNPDTALVTVTIGGNDIRYTSSTFTCAGTAANENCSANLDQAMIKDAVNQLPVKLGEMLDAIKVKAPQASIVLVTYPRVFSSDATSCSELDLGADDTVYLAALGHKLQAAFVSAASSRQILIADAYVIGEFHGPCAATERWVNGATVAETGIPFHPSAKGHIEMARLVLAVLGGNED